MQSQFGHRELAASQAGAVDLLATLGYEAEQEFDDIAELAAAVCGTPISLVTLLDTEWQFHKGAVGLPASPLPISESFCRHVLLHDAAFIVHDARRDPRFEHNPLVTGSPAIRFYAGVSLYSPAGAKVGALCVLDTIERDLKENQVHALVLLAKQVNARFELRVRSREAEEALDALRASQQLVAGFSAGAPFAYFIKDRSGRLLYSNARGSEFLGVAPAACEEILSLWPPDKSLRAQAEEERIFVAWHSATSDEQTVAPDGEVIQWELHRSPFYGPAGEQLLAGFAIDVTNRP